MTGVDHEMKKIFLVVFGLSIVSSPVIADTPYAGQELRSIKSLSARDIEALRNGEGMGFAKLAELNHYPGPKHVLDLAQELDLTPQQRAQTEALFVEMQTKAKNLGQDLLQAEADLDLAFARRDIDAESLEKAVLEIGEIRARLRFVHLDAHLRQRNVLSETQIETYDRLRGYGNADVDHSKHSSHH